MPPTALVLLADRDADTRLMYAKYLRQLTYEIDEAEDGREALAKAISHDPSMIVTDSRLPGMSGFELCRLVRQDASTRRIPIIIVTDDAIASDVTLAKAAGAEGVLVRPCLPERLAAEISRVLAQSGDQRARSRSVQDNVAAQPERSNDVVGRSQPQSRRLLVRHAHPRRDATLPAAPPQALVCPVCDQPLPYVKSHIGGVPERNREQWDYFECAHGCGTYQYRHRTRKLRRVG